MYINYAKLWGCSIVVFHAQTLNETGILHFRQHLLHAEVSSSVTFIEVDLSLYKQQQLPVSGRSNVGAVCGSSDAETAAASRFLMSGATERLEAMGFHWFFRVADNSRLLEPVHYDVFKSMSSAGRRYGFLSIVRDNPPCVKGLWEACEALCAQFGNCSDLRTAWPEGVVVFTNFEVSHRSVWHSEMFRQLVKRRDESSNAQWGDAAVHTVSVISSLGQNEIHRFEDIRYEAMMNPKGTRSGVSGDKASSRLLGASKLTDLDSVFQPRRFGWLGGDVASSFALPSVLCASVGDKASSGGSCGYDDPTLSRYIWLFGDSLVGTSAGDRWAEHKHITHISTIDDVL